MFRYIFSCLLIICSSRGSAQEKIDILHYRFEIALSDSSDWIQGHAQVALNYTGSDGQFALQLKGVSTEGKGMIVRDVREDGQALRFVQRNDSILIHLPIPEDTHPSRLIDVWYEGVPEDGLIIARNKFGDRTFFADNWPDRAHHWIPCVDRPDEKASFEFLVTAPSQYSVVSNGRKLEETVLRPGWKTTHWSEEISLPTKIMVIGVARFAEKTFADSPANLPISAWSYPQDSSRTFRNFSPATAIVRFLSAYIAPFPYEKLANVQSKTIFGGMENAGAIFYDENLSAADGSIESLLTHEIVHQWFGDMATEKNFAHLWLSEGFATYLTHIYMEAKYGRERLKYEMRDDREAVVAFSKSSKQAVVDSISPYRRLLNPNSYQKGGWVLHMLRRQLGDSVFHKIIREYYREYAGKNADSRDFQKLCERVSGKNLEEFFRQWLYTAGQPQLSVKWNYDKKSRNIVIALDQVQPSSFVFPLDVEIRFQNGSTQVTTLQVALERQEFRIPVKQKPLKLTLDPGVNLLFDGEIIRTN